MELFIKIFQNFMMLLSGVAIVAFVAYCILISITKWITKH